MLPGGWLLAFGDEAGALGLSDIRMMGGGKGARLLWSVKAAHGPLASIAWAVAPSGGSGHGGATAGLLPLGVAGGGGARLGALVSGGQDGAVRVWQPSDGQLLQSVEGGRQGARPASAGAASPVTGLAPCAEGVVACYEDGTVRLLPFVAK